MKKVLLSMVIAVFASSMVVTDADARRMGGGGSFGKQSPGAARQMQSPQQPARPAEAARPAQQGAAAAAAPARSNMMRNILGGALLGLGLGALLSHLGIGGALASIIGTILTFALIALAIMFIVRMVRRKNGTDTMQPAYAGPSQKSGQTPEIGSRIGAQTGGYSAQPSALQGAAAGTAAAADDGVQAPYGVPADFDVAGFVRQAKTQYIRLQAAWDRGDIDDIREFTAPEIFAELKMQLQERGDAPNHTDVMLLEADLLGIETVGEEYLASVRFSGMIKEEQDAPAKPVNEVWNLAKPVSGRGGWLLAGIQQGPTQQ